MMMSYDRTHGPPSNVFFTFDFGRHLHSHLDCHSIALNAEENSLLLVGNHELKLIHFETLASSMINPIDGEEPSLIIPCASNIQSVPLFDLCNVNRPIVQWNHHNPYQYAVAVDRLVRIYTIGQSQVNELDTIIDTQHQRPISTISYWPYDPHALLTGSLDGQVQLWDIRQCSLRTPANLKLTISTPFSIRHIQWPSIPLTNANSNQLAIQCDQCIRIYDMRRPSSYVSSIEHEERVLSVGWTRQQQSIVSLSMDNSLRVFSPHGQLLAKSIADETTASMTMSKIRTTASDKLLVCATRDSLSSNYGLTGWRWDEDQRLRPLSDRILAETPSPILDFALVSHSRFLNLFQQACSSRSNDSSLTRLPVLAWCQDEQLRLIEMDYSFRQVYHDYTRPKRSSLSKPSIIHSRSLRSSISKTTMDIIQDETSNSDQSDFEEDALHDLSSSSRINSLELPETPEENDSSIVSDRSFHTNSTVSVENELNSLHDQYGQYISVEIKDEPRRLCILRCLYPVDTSRSFRVYLFLSRHYPVVSQLFVRFKVLVPIQPDERFTVFQRRMQWILDETSSKDFYHGQLTLHRCLLTLEHFFQRYLNQEEISSTQRAKKTHRKKRSLGLNESFELETSQNGHMNKTNKTFSMNPLFDLSLSSMRQYDVSPVSNTPSIRANPRTCGARFVGGTYLICFGRTTTPMPEPMSAPPILSTAPEKSIHRPHPFHMRSTSLTVTKSRVNSSTDDQLPSHRSSMGSSKTVHIQAHTNGPRTTIFSAPVRSLLGIGVFTDHQRQSGSFRRPLTQQSQTNSTISIYDMSILLPINKKLADDYKVDFSDTVEMCEMNRRLTEDMAKDELAHCWRLLSGLMAVQSTLSSDHPWFQTPIARGLIQHLVSYYIKEGDIQSASMFLLTMLKSSYMNGKLPVFDQLGEQSSHPILYAYASLLHRWKHFYKRTQIFQQISSESATPPSQSSSTKISCSLCLQPILGQYVLCAMCGHGGHLAHIHQWFSSSNAKHRYCPEQDCTCRCLLRQQESLTLHTNPAQPTQSHTPTLTPRAYSHRHPSSSATAVIRS